MTVNATGFWRSRVTIFASVTYPFGYSVTQFDKGGDAYDVPAIVIGEADMGPNGDLITYASASTIEFTVNVPTNSEDDRALTILGEANRPARGKRPINDRINIVTTFPDGRVVTLIELEIITSFSPMDSMADTGKLKTKKNLNLNLKIG